MAAGTTTGLGELGSGVDPVGVAAGAGAGGACAAPGFSVKLLIVLAN